MNNFLGVIFHTVTAEPRAGADQKGEAPQNNIIFVITSSIYFNQMPASVLGWVWVGGGGGGGGGWGEEGGLGGGVGGDRLLKGSYESTNSSLFSYKLRYHLTNTHQAFRV